MTDQTPSMPAHGGAQGVQIQGEPKVPDQIPHCAWMAKGVQAQTNGTSHIEGRLRAPFPYYGGKGRWADAIWQRLGSPGVYVEPFLGSGAVLLAKPGGAAPREVVCDTNGHICNFMRALVGDYEQTAYWADWPTIHQDLTARHRWLLRWGAEHAERLSEDPDWYDPKAAGWWVWGISSWIGHGWCDATQAAEKRPALQNGNGTGIGVQMQRTTLPVERDQIPEGDRMPFVAGSGGGGGAQGVQIQRKRMPVEDKRPRCNERGGQGVQQQRVGVPAGAEGYDRRPDIQDRPNRVSQQSALEPSGTLDGSRLRPWFRALAQRLARVIVLNRSWESAVTDSVLQQTPSSPKPVVGVFLDPPYRTANGRSTGLYVGDTAGKSDDVAAASYEWAVANGARYRVAYACHVGDFEIPPGWEVETRGFSGHRDEVKKAESTDCVMYSPACVGQGSLF